MKTILLIPILFITTFYSWSNVVIVKVNYSYLNFDKIDDRNLKTFEFGSIFSERAKTELNTLNSSFNGIIKWKAEKIFFNLTTKDTISISRLGEKVTIPPFWATFRLHVPSNFSTERIIQFLDNFQPLVEYAHYDFPAYLQSTPNDTLYNKQISLNGSALHPNAGINIEEAWNIEKGKSFIKVGVHDSGIDTLHPDLDVVFGGAYFNEYLPNMPYGWGEDTKAHGTLVAGIIGAKSNNTTGIAGIAGGDGGSNSGVSLIDLRMDFSTNSNLSSFICASVVDAARSVYSYWNYPQGYNYENDYFNNAPGFGVHIGNHSYIIKTNSPIPNESSDDPIEKDLGENPVTTPTCVLCREAYLFSLKNGVINVASRGNSQHFSPSTDPTIIENVYPQSFPDNWLISVGASGYDGVTVQNGLNQTVQEFTSGYWSMYGGNMDLIAPGSDSIVYTTHVINSSTNSNPYRKMNGTSAAAPHVSGVAALLLSHYNQNCYSQSNLAVEDIEYILEKSATNLYGAGYDDTTGWGRLDAYKALQMIENPTKQIVHPDSLVSSVVVERDTIVFKYNKAFVADGWGPLSRPFPLTQNKVYQAERILVENTYSFSEFITASTEILDYWPRFSSSNAIDYLDDSLRVFIPKPPTGQIDTTLSFDVFDVTPFNSIYFFDPNEKLVKTRGYYYHIIAKYLDIDENNSPDVLNIENVIDEWYPIDIETSQAALPISIYIKDSTLVSRYNSPCDSDNPLFDETLGIVDNQIGIDVKIFPNPTKNYVYIKSNQENLLNIVVLDNRGVEIINKNVNSKEIELDLTDLSSGLYFIKCNSAKGFNVNKLIKL
jgi:subtilisin family serine protease